VSRSSTPWRTKLFLDTPAHDWSSHLADAFCYLAVGWEEPVDANDWTPEPPPDLYFNLLTYQREQGQHIDVWRR
jgi:hypothetical protein